MQRYLEETEIAIADQLTDGVYRVPGLIELGVVAIVDGQSVKFTQIDPLFETDIRRLEGLLIEGGIDGYRYKIHPAYRSHYWQLCWGWVILKNGSEVAEGDDATLDKAKESVKRRIEIEKELEE